MVTRCNSLLPPVCRSVSSTAAAAAALAQGEADQHHPGLGGRAAGQGPEQSRRRLQVGVTICSSVARMYFLCCKKMKCQNNEINNSTVPVAAPPPPALPAHGLNTNSCDLLVQFTVMLVIPSLMEMLFEG